MRTKSMSHHFESVVETIFCRDSQGSHHVHSFLGGAKWNSFNYSMLMHERRAFGSALRKFGSSSHVCLGKRLLVGVRDSH